MEYECADDKVERVICERHLFGVSLDETEVPEGALRCGFFDVEAHFWIGIETGDTSIWCLALVEIKISS